MREEFNIASNTYHFWWDSWQFKAYYIFCSIGSMSWTKPHSWFGITFPSFNFWIIAVLPSWGLLAHTASWETYKQEWKWVQSLERTQSKPSKHLDCACRKLEVGPDSKWMASCLNYLSWKRQTDKRNREGWREKKWNLEGQHSDGIIGQLQIRV